MHNSSSSNRCMSNKIRMQLWTIGILDTSNSMQLTTLTLLTVLLQTIMCKAALIRGHRRDKLRQVERQWEQGSSPATIRLVLLDKSKLLRRPELGPLPKLSTLTMELQVQLSISSKTREPVASISTAISSQLPRWHQGNQLWWWWIPQSRHRFKTYSWTSTKTPTQGQVTTHNMITESTRQESQTSITNLLLLS